MGAAVTPPGWYPDVERPGGERYWDGSAWTEHRRGGNAPPASGGAPRFGEAAPTSAQQAVPPGHQPPGILPPNYGPATYGSTPGYQTYAVGGSASPKSAIAGWALGLSIAGLVLSCCGGILLSIPGTIMGWTQMQAVDRGERDPASRGTAKAAFIVGIVGMSLFASLIVFWGISLAVGGS